MTADANPARVQLIHSDGPSPATIRFPLMSDYCLDPMNIVMAGSNHPLILAMADLDRW